MKKFLLFHFTQHILKGTEFIVDIFIDLDFNQNYSQHFMGFFIQFIDINNNEFKTLLGFVSFMTK